MMYRNQCTPRENLLNRINEVSFAVNDILLYLDTHPKCKEGFAFYQECDKERQKLMKEYSQCYGPLTIDDALEGYLEMGRTAISVGSGRRLQIIYVEL